LEVAEVGAVGEHRPAPGVGGREAELPEQPGDVGQPLFGDVGQDRCHQGMLRVRQQWQVGAGASLRGEHLAHQLA
jgi:hypothetical protein